MKKVFIPLLSFLIVAMMTCTAFAITFQQRIDSQQLRINRGITKGELTRKEAQELQKNLNHIRFHYRRMLSDGILTVKERALINGMLDKSSRMIYDQRYDRQKRVR